MVRSVFAGLMGLVLLAVSSASAATIDPKINYAATSLTTSSSIGGLFPSSSVVADGRNGTSTNPFFDGAVFALRTNTSTGITADFMPTVTTTGTLSVFAQGGGLLFSSTSYVSGDAGSGIFVFDNLSGLGPNATSAVVSFVFSNVSPTFGGAVYSGTAMIEVSRVPLPGALLFFATASGIFAAMRKRAAAA